MGPRATRARPSRAYRGVAEHMAMPVEQLIVSRSPAFTVTEPASVDCIGSKKAWIA
jgi:hypothetical protein